MVYQSDFLEGLMFTGKKIWLIGASEGIGEALARALSKEGARLFLSARNREKLQALCDSLGTSHRAIAMDVTQLSEVERAWSEIQNEAIDLVIYNAGTYEPMDAAHFDLAKVEHMLDVNLRGAYRVLAKILPDFIVRNAGHVALVASVAGYLGLPAAIGYGASKAALIHLAENLRADLVRSAIKVQMINPGFVATRLTAKNDFTMPCIISAEEAANRIIRGLSSSAFEIHFPKRFSFFLKLLAVLPYAVYFRVLRKVV